MQCLLDVPSCRLYRLTLCNLLWVSVVRLSHCSGPAATSDEHSGTAAMGRKLNFPFGAVLLYSSGCQDSWKSRLRLLSLLKWLFAASGLCHLQSRASGYSRLLCLAAALFGPLSEWEKWTGDTNKSAVLYVPLKSMEQAHCKQGRPSGSTLLVGERLSYCLNYEGKRFDRGHALRNVIKAWG